MGKKVTFIIIGIIVAIGLFYGGDKYGESKAAAAATAARSQFASGFAGRTGGARAGANGGLVAGQILSADSQSITVSLMGGGSKIVFFTASTTIIKTSLGSTSDLQSGTNVTVTGSTNSDGSVTASSIQIRPAGMTFGGRASSTSSQ